MDVIVRSKDMSSDKIPATQTVRVQRRFKAEPERVFDAWLEPASARLWMFATPTGQMQRVDIDGRVGQHFTVIERRDGQDVEHVGTYVEVESPRRLAFDFKVPQFSNDSTRVSIDIAPKDAGSELTLTHEGVLADYAERTAQGWKTMLDGLAEALGDDD